MPVMSAQRTIVRIFKFSAVYNTLELMEDQSNVVDGVSLAKKSIEICCYHLAHFGWDIK